MAEVEERIARLQQLLSSPCEDRDDDTLSRTLRNLDWFQVTEIRGHLQEGQIADWQISMKVGFRLEE